MWGNVTAKKLRVPCFHALRKGVLKFTALTTTLSAISTSASTSTNFHRRSSRITSDGSGRRSAPLKAKMPESHKTFSTSTADSSNNVLRGWALKAKKCSRFTEQVKSFLPELFLFGEESGHKVTLPDASIRIRIPCRDGANQRLFDKEEWLTAQ